MHIWIRLGNSRADNVEDLSKYHIVLTTYSVMETEYRREIKGFKVYIFFGDHKSGGYGGNLCRVFIYISSCFVFKSQGKLVHQKSLLHQIKWHRIVLDEGKDSRRGTKTIATSRALRLND